MKSTKTAKFIVLEKFPLYGIIAFVDYDKIFEVAVKSTKTAKFIVLEKFPLYGIVITKYSYCVYHRWSQIRISALN